MSRRIPALLLVTLLWVPSAHAGGLFTPDAGIVAIGRGGAFTALADDNAALRYNPAGLWQMDGFQLRGGLMGMQTPSSFLREGGPGRYKLDANGDYLVDDEGNPYLDGPYTEVSNLDSFRPIPEFSLSYGFEKPDLTIALGLYAPPAPWISYDLYGAQRYRLTRLRLIQGNFALGVGWRLPGPVDFISIGATFQMIYVSMEQQLWATADIESSGSNPEHPQWDALTTFEASQWQPWGNVGLMIQPHPVVRIGFSFDPPYTFNGKGSATLEGEMGGEYLEGLRPILELINPDFDSSPLNLTGVDDDISVTTHQPAVLRGGVMVQPTNWLNLELDGVIEFWNNADAIVGNDIEIPLQSCDEDGCQPFLDELEERVDLSSGSVCDMGFVDCTSLGTYRGAAGDGKLVIPQKYRNTWSIRFGGEIQPIPETLGIRFGYAYESSAIPDETLSVSMIDSDKHLVGVGVSGRFTGFEVHFSYGHVFYQPRDVPAAVSEGTQVGLEGVPLNTIDAGEYKASTDYIGLNLVFDFTSMHRARKAKAQALADEEQRGAPPAQTASLFSM